MNFKKKRRRIKRILTCCGIMLALYYLLPVIGFAFEPAKAEIYLSVGLIYLAFPLYLYVSSIFLGFKQGLCTVYAVAACVLFFPTMLIYFNAKMWPAAIVYGAIALCGNLMGWGLKRLLKKMKESMEG